MVQRLSLMVPNFVVNLIQHRFFVLLCFVWIIVLKISPPLFKWLALPEKSQKERLSSQLVWIFHSFVFQSDAADTSNIKPDFSRYESSGRLRKILMLTKLLLFHYWRASTALFKRKRTDNHVQICDRLAQNGFLMKLEMKDIAISVVWFRRFSFVR